MRRLLVGLALWLGLALAPAHALPVGFTVYGGCNPSVTKVIAITSGTSYTIPADYCSLVEVDAIGEGGGSTSGSGGGGGGGGWANLTGATYAANQSITVQIGAGGSSTATCWVSCATLKADFGVSGSSVAVGGAGGSSNVGTTTHNGGAGSSTNSGAGGGAGGPNGNGNAGGAVTGGSGDAGSGGAGGGGGSGGSPGTEYSLTAGGSAGSGGGAGSASLAAGPGGAYGGGGSGCASVCAPANGGAGVIIFQYHPNS